MHMIEFLFETIYCSYVHAFDARSRWAGDFVLEVTLLLLRTA